VIVLASGSASRRAMLEAAGVRFEAMPPAVDERAVEAALEVSEPTAIALALAEAKALAVSRAQPGQLVLGSDSLVTCAGRRFDKPASRAEAAEHLRWFSNRTIELHSAAALARDGCTVWRCGDLARLAVRPLSDDFIGGYLDVEWPAVSYCVGVFRIEGPGVQLFSRIDGDHFTVLGMPLLPVLQALREIGELPA
jgi:septum formation protein